MSPEQFRRAALALPEALESAHMGHPDFRVRKKIFATLAAAPKAQAVLKFSHEQQELFVRVDPVAFAPVAGGWGRKGWTQLLLGDADPALVHDALLTAWRNVAPKTLVATLERAAASPD